MRAVSSKRLKFSIKACRWLGYAADIEQPVPCHGNGDVLAPAAANKVDHTGQAPRMPPGYMKKDRGREGVQTQWTEAQSTPASTWFNDSRLKYSAKEMLARGKSGASLQKQVCCVAWHCCPAHAWRCCCRYTVVLVWRACMSLGFANTQESLAFWRRTRMQVDQPTMPSMMGKTREQRATAVDGLQKLLGVRGEPLFSSLSYFKCAT